MTEKDSAEHKIGRLALAHFRGAVRHHQVKFADRPSVALVSETLYQILRSMIDDTQMVATAPKEGPMNLGINGMAIDGIALFEMPGGDAYEIHFGR